MKGCRVGWLNLQCPAVVSNGSLKVLQTVIREGPVVEGSAVAWIQGHCPGVVLDCFLKAPLREQTIMCMPLQEFAYLGTSLLEGISIGNRRLWYGRTFLSDEAKHSDS